MKKIWGVFLIFLSLFMLASCSTQKSYKKLSEMKSEIEEGYISFGRDGIVVDGDYNKLTYKDIFDIDICIDSGKRVDDYLILVSLTKDYFYHTKYNLKDDSMIKNKMELKNGGNSKLYEYKDEYVIINYGDNNIDTAYVIDDDFNIKTQILTNVSGTYSVICIRDYGVIFGEMVRDTNKNLEYLKQMFLYKDNEFKSIEIDNPISYTIKYSLSHAFSIAIAENYYVEYIDNFEVTFIYNLDTNEVEFNACDKRDNISYKYDEDLYSGISDYIKVSYGYNRIIDDMPDFKDVKKNKDFYMIIRAYNREADIQYASTRKDYYGNDYYIIHTNCPLHQIIWISDSSTVDLEPSYIFRYNEETNDITYVGYSKGDLIFFCIR